MKILAIDFGEKRIGLATSDPTGILATPRRTVVRRDDEQAVGEILEFGRDEQIELLLVGLPRSPQGVESVFAARIRSFAAKLAARATVRVRFHEETLTSDEAARRIRAGLARQPADPVAAAVLLEDYLQHEPHAATRPT